MARLSHHASGVALVDHHQRIVFLGQVADFVYRGDVAVHREHTVGDDDAETLGLRLLQTVLQLSHIGIGIAVALSLAQPHAVDDGCMVQSIADNGIVLGKQRFKHTAVGIEARRIKNSVVSPEVTADGALQLLVDVLCAADEPHARHAEAATVHHTLRGLDDTRMVREPQVVVGTKVQHLTAANLDGSTL